MEKIISVLRKQLVSTSILSEEDLLQKYSHDWSYESPVTPKYALRPSSSHEVSIILKTCFEHGQSVVIQGGLTGLCGGATPREGELSISLERLNKIEKIDEQAMTITVGAGVTLEAIQNAASSVGLMFPLDLGARGSCQIGGNIATNAGGNQVIRYGMTRELVLGLEAVLADGTLIDSMGTLLKDNTGYDLKHLFIGSEGTLGIVTRAVLRLYPETPIKNTALCALGSFKNCIELLNYARKALSGSLTAFEVMWASYYDAVMTHVSHVGNPFGCEYNYYVLIETSGTNQDEELLRFQKFLEDQFDKHVILDATLADNLKQAENIWAIRDGVGELLPLCKSGCTFDVGVPIAKMEQFIEDVGVSLSNQYPDIQMWAFGHIGDGNLHLITDTGSKQDKENVYETVYKECQKVQGSISAEHGIGVLKKPYLKYSRGVDEVGLMKKIKSTLDPKGILNPGRLF